MATYYAGRIRRGKMRIEDVPERWREETERVLASV
ncbi:CD1375 family protein [Eggerthella guodeyinii]